METIVRCNHGEFFPRGDYFLNINIYDLPCPKVLKISLRDTQIVY